MRFLDFDEDLLSCNVIYAVASDVVVPFPSTFSPHVQSRSEDRRVSIAFAEVRLTTGELWKDL